MVVVWAATGRRMERPMDQYTLVILVANAMILFGSGTVALLARRAFRRSRIAALRTVAVGFACLGVGAATGGYLYIATESLYTGVIAQSTATAVGVLIVVYSLYQTSTDDIASPPVDS